MRPLIARSSSPAPKYPVVLLVIFYWALWAPCAQGESLTERFTGDPDVPWQISADKVAYDAEFSTYNVSGNVIIEKQATRLMADRVSFNQKTMTAAAAGHVVMTAGDDILTGERIDLNLDQETGVLHGGSLFLKENHFYIRGERIEKTGKETYQARGVSITSCDGDRPDWIISGRTLKVTIEGYGSVTHAVLKTRNLPGLYSPYLFFPAKTKRQTGLLIPDVDLSDRWGFAWDQPLFWEFRFGSWGRHIQFSLRYAMRKGKWKLMMNADGTRCELFDLEFDLVKSHRLDILDRWYYQTGWC